MMVRIRGNSREGNGKWPDCGSVLKVGPKKNPDFLNTCDRKVTLKVSLEQRLRVEQDLGGKLIRSSVLDMLGFL